MNAPFAHEPSPPGEPLLDRVAEQASAFAQRGADAVRDGAEHLRGSARRAGDRISQRAAIASDSTLAYVQAQPLKSLLIAAGTGAALMALLGLLTRHRDRG